MHVVDLLEEALGVAMNSGFEVRQEWLNENGGGLCRLGQRRMLFVDLSLTAHEQLEQIIESLANYPDLRLQPTNSPELRRLLTASVRRAAIENQPLASEFNPHAILGD
jgi:hypothetical protein